MVPKGYNFKPASELGEKRSRLRTGLGEKGLKNEEGVCDCWPGISMGLGLSALENVAMNKNLLAHTGPEAVCWRETECVQGSPGSGV